jgi:hypothetical protein
VSTCSSHPHLPPLPSITVYSKESTTSATVNQSSFKRCCRCWPDTHAVSMSTSPASNDVVKPGCLHSYRGVRLQTLQSCYLKPVLSNQTASVLSNNLSAVLLMCCQTRLLVYRAPCNDACNLEQGIVEVSGCYLPSWYCLEQQSAFQTARCCCRLRNLTRYYGNTERVKNVRNVSSILTHTKSPECHVLNTR